MLSEAEAAWLACAIDTEGSIMFTKQGRYSRPRIAVYNTNLDWITKFADLTGASWSGRAPNGYGEKRVYSSVINARKQILALLQSVLPHLIIKKYEAEKVLNWIRNEGLPCG